MATVSAVVCLFVLAVPGITLSGTAGDGLDVTVNSDGTYSLSVNGKVWLPSAATYFYSEGKRYSSADGSLKLIRTSSSAEGISKLGTWKGTEFIYQAGNTMVSAVVKIYLNNPNFVIFGQKYFNETYGASTGNLDSVSSAFPSFQIIGGPDELGYLNFAGDMFGSTFLQIGTWTNETAVMTTGSTGGPIVIFDHSQNVLIQSPSSQFMSSSNFKEGNAVSWGVMGSVNNIPASYESETIVFYGNRGINEAMTDWGKLMRYYYDRDQSLTENDLTNNYLGFWTDNGAYYYHVTEKNKTFEQTILDAKTYSDQAGIPYRYVQYDDWWYYVGDYGGDLVWEPMPSVFPHGMQYIYNKTGWPVLAHNRWWAPNTKYAKQNGGKYNFIVEETKALPQDKDFWTDLLAEARKWGLVTYEQDWLNQQFIDMNATVSIVNVARDWLMQMGAGAAKNDMTLHYCLANPKEALQALEIPTVVNARVSQDYQPSRVLNWNIGVASIFADAIGVRPFKDNFWTSYVEPDNRYKSNETHPALESVIATLSTGPVGPGDMVGGSNVTLIMLSCNADGLLLQPSRPARSIDSNIMQKAFGDGSGPDGEVWSTWSAISGYTFGIILAPIQTSPVQVTPSDAGFGPDFPTSMIFKHTWPLPTETASFSDTEQLTIGGCDPRDPCLWHTAPVWNVRGLPTFIYGELQKWVPMSPKRVTNIEVTTDDIHVTVVGAVNEVIQFTFGTAVAMNTVSCNLGTSGSAIIQAVAKSCTQL